MKNKYLSLQVALLATLAMFALAVSSEAIEQRTFHSADKTKSFEASLDDYHSKKKKVTVVFASGVKKSFPLAVLSKECQDYVLANAGLLALTKSVSLQFKEVKLKGDGGAVATGYTIAVNNRGNSSIEDVSLNYTLYYRQGDLNKGGTEAKTRTGSLKTSKIFDHDTVYVNTAQVDIVRKSKPASGGGGGG